MWSLILQDADLNAAFKNAVLMEMLAMEANLNQFLLGEGKPLEIIDQAPDAGLFITIHVPVKLASWKSFLKQPSDRIEFRVYRYLNGSTDEAELVYEELGIETEEPEIYHHCEVCLLPGRYYFRLSGCESAFCESSSFRPEHEFIAFNASDVWRDRLPRWTDVPSSPYWFALYELEFHICYDSMYLGYRTEEIPDRNLLAGAFYHCPDRDGILRTFIYNGEQQVFEGIRL